MEQTAFIQCKESYAYKIRGSRHSHLYLCYFQRSKRVCRSLDRAVKKFWWSSRVGGKRYMALKAWDEICKPKDLGMLGLEDSRT